MNMLLNKLITFLMLLVAMSPHTQATMLTFEGSIAGSNMSFSIVGDVWDPLYTNTGIRNYEYSISSLSDWVLYDPTSPPASHSVLDAYTQTLLSVGPQDSTSNFRYHETISAYNPSTLEYWGHNINIRALPDTSLLFDGLVGLQDAFTYREIFATATNYTFDGSTQAEWTRNIAEGFLTLTSVDYTVGLSNDIHPPSSVPEPASIYLLILGLLGMLRIKYPSLRH